MRSYLTLALFALAVVGMAASCHSVFGLTDYQFTGGAGGVGASGGTGGSVVDCVVPADCPGEDTTCAALTCEAGVCGEQQAAADAPCTEDGGSVCDGEGACVACNTSDHCGAAEICDNHLCVPDSCANLQQDGDETDVDCGGTACAPCVNGLTCLEYRDCVSHFCDTGGGTGGAGGAGGGGGGTGICAPCTDDIECSPVTPAAWCEQSGGDGACVDKGADGEACGGDNECVSGFCPTDDGVCCNGLCDFPCVACRQMDTGQPDGTCAPEAAGCSCAEQYDVDPPVHEMCTETPAQCDMRMAVQQATCGDYCQSRGGECVDMYNDQPSGTCGISAGEQWGCDAIGYASVICQCSRGCGNGPLCVPPQVCLTGTCQ